MDKPSNIEKKVQAALNSLDGLQAASPQPFFYTRLESRFLRNEKSVWEDIGRILSRPMISVLTILALVFLNTLVVINKEPATVRTIPDQSEMAFVDQYEQATSFYDLENAQP